MTPSHRVPGWAGTSAAGDVREDRGPVWEPALMGGDPQEFVPSEGISPETSLPCATSVPLPRGGRLRASPHSSCSATAPSGVTCRCSSSGPPKRARRRTGFDGTCPPRRTDARAVGRGGVSTGSAMMRTAELS